MGDVVDIDEHRPWNVGFGVCGACGHHTINTYLADQGLEGLLECSKCRAMKVLIVDEAQWNRTRAAWAPTPEPAPVLALKPNTERCTEHMVQVVEGLLAQVKEGKIRDLVFGVHGNEGERVLMDCSTSNGALLLGLVSELEDHIRTTNKARDR